ncbi:unnamed protein product [Dibothriocephalus latus]|uniref:Uncharacterized protein n=1 Tax=Dibothriocephalus latus TaxID=60516 RepID=A0A3P7MZP2_DIBLA|nr:unnamed protein product [Dibothriocephalus latus]
MHVCLLAAVEESHTPRGFYRPSESTNDSSSSSSGSEHTSTERPPKDALRVTSTPHTGLPRVESSMIWFQASHASSDSNSSSSDSTSSGDGEPSDHASESPEIQMRPVRARYLRFQRGNVRRLSTHDVDVADSGSLQDFLSPDPVLPSQFQ